MSDRLMRPKKAVPPPTPVVNRVLMQDGSALLLQNNDTLRMQQTHA